MGHIRRVHLLMDLLVERRHVNSEWRAKENAFKRARARWPCICTARHNLCQLHYVSSGRDFPLRAASRTLQSTVGCWNSHLTRFNSTLYPCKFVLEQLVVSAASIWKLFLIYLKQSFRMHSSLSFPLVYLIVFGEHALNYSIHSS